VDVLRLGEGLKDGMRVRFAEFVLDSHSREVRRGEQVVHLTLKAFDLLACLIEGRPRVLTRAQLLDRVWPATFVADSNLASLVKEVRRALGDDARSPRFVRTAHRHGYAFRAEAVIEEGSGPVATGLRVSWPGHEAVLVEGTNVLGRTRGAAIHVDDGSVSRRHAVIRVIAGRAVIQDCGSKNGTFVGTRRVRAECPLTDGDIIRVGKVRLRFRTDALEPSTFTTSGS